MHTQKDRAIMTKKEQKAIAAAAKIAADLAAKQAAELAAKQGPELAAKIAKALDGITPEQAAASLAQDKAKLSAGAKKAWETRRANGNNGTGSAKQAWETRRAIRAALAELAAKAS
jgi:hypothetical protein